MLLRLYCDFLILKPFHPCTYQGLLPTTKCCPTFQFIKSEFKYYFCFCLSFFFSTYSTSLGISEHVPACGSRLSHLHPSLVSLESCPAEPLSTFTDAGEIQCGELIWSPPKTIALHCSLNYNYHLIFNRDCTQSSQQIPKSQDALISYIKWQRTCV